MNSKVFWIVLVKSIFLPCYFPFNVSKIISQCCLSRKASNQNFPWRSLLDVSTSGPLLQWGPAFQIFRNIYPPFDQLLFPEHRWSSVPFEISCQMSLCSNMTYKTGMKRNKKTQAFQGLRPRVPLAKWISLFSPLLTINKGRNNIWKRM